MKELLDIIIAIPKYLFFGLVSLIVRPIEWLLNLLTRESPSKNKETTTDNVQPLDQADPSESSSESSAFNIPTAGSRTKKPTRKKRKNFSRNELEGKILHSMCRMGKYGANTTPQENAIKGVPVHQIGEAKIALKTLIKDGYIAEKTSQGRMHVYLTQKGHSRADTNNKTN